MRVWKKMINEDIVICAFRYALGRSSYIVCSVTDYLIETWPMLSDKLQDLIIEEIVEAINEERVGDEVDVSLWKDVLANCDEEHLNSINERCREDKHKYTILDV